MASRKKVTKIATRTDPVDVVTAPIQRFLNLETSGGIVMLVCAALAMAWANSPWLHAYETIFYEMKISFSIASLKVLGKHPESIYWINDALMAAFFFLVGLEIKREVLIGELSSLKKAAVPLFAAIGGMVVPGAIYAAINWGEPSLRGWGVPMATDIAFALGVMALLGNRVPVALRVFLAALAIADDLGALIIIAAFYTEHLELMNLALAGVCLSVMAGMNLMGVRRTLPYAVVGLLLWFFVLESGVHATIAGVLGALTIPVRSQVDTTNFMIFSRQRIDELEEEGKHGESIVTSPMQQGLVQSIEDACNKVQSPLHQLEHAMAPWIAFVIVPIFALANAGVPLQGDLTVLATSKVPLGVALGLVLGKPIGIMLASWMAVRLGLGTLPRGVTWKHLHGAAWLGGIGFTMSLFIATLAFPSRDDLNASKLAILVGSAIAGVVGLLILWSASKSKK
ncbi:MAG: Na+/H+ antiporter NhaA [Phycisphaerales bacterium]|nr:Na+/H+ antiporter NhaA [Phycisphaerales bacterium]